MSYTPVEIRHVKLRRGILGYRRGPVDSLLEEITESFETAPQLLAADREPLNPQPQN